MRAVPTWVIARLTLKEAIRRKIALGALLLGLVFLAVYGLGLRYIRQDLVRAGQFRNAVVTNQIFNFLALSGLYVVNTLFAMMAVLTSVDAIAGDIASGRIHTVAAKPVHRWEILLGKWIGLVVMLALYLLLMAGGVTLLTTVVTGYRVPNVVRGVALIWLNGTLLLNVTLLGGTQLSTLANGVVVFAAFGVAFVGGWVEQIGSFLNSEAAVRIGIATSLLMPSEALWKRAAYEMRSAIVSTIGFSPFTSTSSVPNAIMIGYAVAYALAALGLAAWSLQRRDL